MTTQFQGFNPGRHRQIEIPEQFFQEVLPLIDDLAEMKVVLFCLRALRQKEGRYRYLRRADFRQDAALMQGLAVDGEAAARLEAGLQRAVAHNILLKSEVTLDSQPEPLYFVNTAKGRAAVQQLQTGQWYPGEEAQIEILPQRPTIFTIYEENIGLLTPMVAEALKDAEHSYPYDWIVEAIRAAALNNARNWRYIDSILKRWDKEGPPHEKPEPSGSTNGKFHGRTWSDYAE